MSNEQYMKQYLVARLSHEASRIDGVRKLIGEPKHFEDKNKRQEIEDYINSMKDAGHSQLSVKQDDQPEVMIYLKAGYKLRWSDDGNLVVEYPWKNTEKAKGCLKLEEELEKESKRIKDKRDSKE